MSETDYIRAKNLARLEGAQALIAEIAIDESDISHAERGAVLVALADLIEKARERIGDLTEEQP